MKEKSFKVGCLSGAGISQESGVATFRGQDGLWEGHKIEDVATPQGFEKDPVLVWQFYEERRRQGKDCKPNKAHIGIAKLQEKLGVENFSIATQNIDGLHQKAGAKNVLELHGSLWRVRCLKCLKERESYEAFETLPPRCECGGILRPAVVWFYEPLPYEVLEEAFLKAKESDLYLVIGTSAVVEPAASLPRVAKSYGAEVWEINPDETPLTPICDKSWRCKAGDAIDEVTEEILNKKVE